ncbi:unnamed protein product [Prorocentrum cordatum]|uniref:Uncharacterized protein n=1 Tax=Prorocentrum cordatum TaxID=2364126 RepID=A0ABN9Q5X7_9DINO|nr:unnamed protein product [Polarella glacialis]
MFVPLCTLPFQVEFDFKRKPAAHSGDPEDRPASRRQGLGGPAFRACGHTAWDELPAIGAGVAHMQSPPSSHDLGGGEEQHRELGDEHRLSTACSLGGQLREHRKEGQRCELVAARRRANRQRLLGADGAFVGECASGFCGTDCTRRE